MADERERALAAGCDGYITKPVDTRVFPGQVREYLDDSLEEGTRG
jgi:two-component system cell cycle response regulator DivK